MKSRDADQTSRSGLSKLVQETLFKDNWFPVHRALLSKLGWRKATMLHFLLDYLSRMEYKKKNADKIVDGWFYCTANTIEEEMEVSPTQQTDILKQLAQDGILSFQRRGLPSKRYIRINLDKIAETILKWSEDRRKNREKKKFQGTTRMETSVAAQTGTSVVRHTKVRHNSKRDAPTSCGAKSDGEVLLNEKKPSYSISDKKAAEHLKSLYVLHNCRFGKVKAENLLLHNLAKTVRRFKRKYSVDQDRIRAVVEWLRDPEHFGWKFTPRLYTTAAFFEKFTRIEDAMERFEEENSQESVFEKNAREGKEYLNVKFDDPI